VNDDFYNIKQVVEKFRQKYWLAINKPNIINTIHPSYWGFLNNHIVFFYHIKKKLMVTIRIDLLNKFSRIPSFFQLASTQVSKATRMPIHNFYKYLNILIYNVITGN